MIAALRGARAATVFLTRLPAGGHPFTTVEMSWAPVWFPLIGAAVGIVLAALWFATAIFGALPAAAIVFTASLFLTGALHEDGLADTADALGGGRDRTRVLDILKDSRVGSFGALALVASFMVRVAFLAELDDGAPLALVLSQCLARLPPVWLLAMLPYVTPRATSKSSSVARATRSRAGLATITPAALVIGLAWGGHIYPLTLLMLLTTLVVLTVASAALFRSRAGGLTGDFLGAAEQAAEALVLVALLAAAR